MKIVNKYYCPICGNPITIEPELVEIESNNGSTNLKKLKFNCCNKNIVIRIY